MPIVFSFGTLRQAHVQEALFGRRVTSEPARIVGYRVARVRITDPGSIEASGSDVHPALVVDDEESASVEGELLDLTDSELAAVDRYEQVSFQPIKVRTERGREAVAYVPRPELLLED